MPNLKILDPANIESYLINELTSVIADGPAWVEKVAGPVVESDEEKETHVGVGAIPRMNEFTGKRQSQDLLGYKVEIVSKTYEFTLRVLRKELRRDKTGQIQKRIDELKQNFQLHWEELALADIKANAKLGYDGKVLFSTTHKFGKSATQSNAVTRTGTTSATAPTPSEFEDALWLATRNLKEFTDDTGRPVNRGKNDFVLMIPPTFNKAAAGALKAEILLSGGQASSNILVAAQNHTFMVVEAADLAWTDKFALFVSDGRALIRQQERDSLYVETKGEGSDHAFDTAAYEFGGMVDRGTGVGRWQSAIQVTFAA